jgi:hypothetical protein
MTNKTPKTHPAMTAIAAAIALASAPSFAQGIDAPDLTAPAPVADATPAPVAADPLAADQAAPAVADPLAAEAIAKLAAPKAKARTTKSTAARSRPAPARVANAAPAVAAAPAIAAPIAETPAVEPLPIQPEAVPVQAPIAEPPPVAETTTLDPMIPIVGVGVLGLLALTGAGRVVRRRRRRVEEADDAARRQFVGTDADAEAEPAMIAEPMVEAAPSEAPALAEPLVAEQPSPASLIPAAAVAASTPAQSPADCVDAPPGSHVEAACEGPTAENPSVSLKKRLKRAQFFDQREMLVAAGEAVPVEPDAGLPDALEAPEPAPTAREPA